jgi:hypothetical protein
MTIEVVLVERGVGPRGPAGGALIRGSVADSGDLGDIASPMLGDTWVTEDDGHAWLYTDSVAAGAVDGFIDMGPVAVSVLPLPLYAITGHGAALPSGESPVSVFADLDAFEAAISPTAQGEQVQLAIDGAVIMLEGRWSDGAWEWRER